MKTAWLLMGICLAALGSAGTASAAEPLDELRPLYQQAREALRRGKFTAYYPLRRQLDDYPLAPYLDYHHRLSQLSELSPQQAVEILQRLSKTPLYDSFKHRFLSQRGDARDWQAFLTISPEPPRDTTLKCYYYRARLADGDTEKAWQGADALWQSGKSQPKACDPLFAAWTKAGQRTDEMIWQRMELAFDARQGKLLRYLNSKLGNSYRQQGDKLVELYRKPELARYRPPLSSWDETGKSMAIRAIKALARRHPEVAWQRYREWQPYLGTQADPLARSLLYHSLIDDEWDRTLDPTLLRVGTDNLYVIRLRRAIFEGQWDQALQWLDQLSAGHAGKNEWQYWRGYTLMKLGRSEPALALWRPLSQRRNFYGFLLAQQFGKPFQFSTELPDIQPSQIDKVIALPGFARVQELMWLGNETDARNEWHWQMLRLDKPAQAALTAVAYQRQWHSLAVQGTIQAKLWNALPWRFPTAYGDVFKRYARQNSLEMSLLQAVARRESALYPKARSHADAYGLMQLLPSTAKNTAKKIETSYGGKATLYEPQTNIELGSAYYRYLFDKYEGNRILASAAYNAGPHRVERWLERSDGELDLPRFVATIPFRETREYVQAILSYQLIYAHLAGEEPPLVSADERLRKY